MNLTHMVMFSFLGGAGGTAAAAPKFITLLKVGR